MQGKVLKLVGLNCPPEVSTFKTAFEEQGPIIRSSTDQVGSFKHVLSKKVSRMKLYEPTTPNASQAWKESHVGEPTLTLVALVVAIDRRLMPETPPFLAPVGV